MQFIALLIFFISLLFGNHTDTLYMKEVLTGETGLLVGTGLKLAPTSDDILD